MNNQIKITKATIDDMFDLFELANDPEVRENSFNREKIDLETHKKWFNNRLNNKNFVFLVAKIRNDFVGSVRFEKNIDNKFIISIQIHKNFRGKGFGKNLLQNAIKEFANLNGNQSIIAKIKSKNLASIKIFSDVNFIIIEDNKQNFIVMEYDYKDLNLPNIKNLL